MSATPAVTAYWAQLRRTDPALPVAVPEAWAFGATAEQSDRLLHLVLAGAKTGTASSIRDYEAAGDPLPEEGELSIVLDGAGSPRALIRTTRLTVVPFDAVDAEHAAAEGEGDGTLEHWRTAHEQYWREHSEDPRGFDPGMPVLCERFELLHPAPDRATSETESR